MAAPVSDKRGKLRRVGSSAVEGTDTDVAIGREIRSAEKPDIPRCSVAVDGNKHNLIGGVGHWGGQQKQPDRKKRKKNSTG